MSLVRVLSFSLLRTPCEPKDLGICSSESRQTLISNILSSSKNVYFCEMSQYNHLMCSTIKRRKRKGKRVVQMPEWIVDFLLEDNDFKPALTQVDRIYSQKQPAKGLVFKEAKPYSFQTLAVFWQLHVSPVSGSNVNLSHEAYRHDKSS